MNGKEKYGQYMTPDLMAEFMTSLISNKENPYILEPSCGEGIFLQKLRDKGYNNILAYEIDTEIIKNDNSVIYSSFISTKHEDTFDIVIGNPPYIRWKNLEEDLKEELKESKLWNKYLNALNDYSSIFIIKAVEALKEGGELIFITPDYWIDTTHSLNLRNYMVDNGYFERIFLFKEAPIFKGATVSLMVFKYIKSKLKNKNEKNIKVSKYNKQKAPSKQVFELMINFENDCNEDVESFEIPQFKKDKYWIFAREEELKIIEKYEEKCTTVGDNLFDTKMNILEDVCDIGNGMVSGLDKAFQIPKNIILTDEEEAATINVVKGQNLEQFVYNDVTKYIFINEEITEDQFLLKYPNFNDLLSPFKEQLKKRYSYNRKINYWEWVFLRNYNTFKNNERKIFVPGKERISNKDYVRFSIVNETCYPTQDVSALIPLNETNESIEYICAILNSKYVFEWIKHKGIIKGHIAEFSRAPLSRIPFRKIDFNCQREVQLHNEITDAVRSYIETREEYYKTYINELIDKLMF